MRFLGRPMPTPCSLSNHYRLVCLPSSSRVQRIDKIWVVEVDLIWVDAYNRTLKSLCQLRQNSTTNGSGTHLIFCAFRPSAGSICPLERLHNKSRNNMSLLDSVRHRFWTKPDPLQVIDRVFSSAYLGPGTFERRYNDTII